MCLVIAHHDLGPADVLLDLDEGLLVLRPSLTPFEQKRAARRILAESGIVQKAAGAWCRCGDLLDLLDHNGGRGRVAQVAALTFATAAGVILTSAATAAPAAAEAYATPAWQAAKRVYGLTGCTYDDGAAECSSRHHGRVTVRTDSHPGVPVEYHLEGVGLNVAIRRFESTTTRDAWLTTHAAHVSRFAEQSAIYKPGPT